MNSLLFDLAFWVTVPFWGLMIFAPAWSSTARVVSSPLIVLPTLGVWVVLAATRFPELWAAVSAPSLDGFSAFLAADTGAVALIWAQVIAWDLFIGRWMFLDSRARGPHPLIMGPLLVLTILLSPIGVVLYLVLRHTKPLPA